MNLFKRARKGFTLVELLICVVIAGIVASALIPRFSNNTDKARTTVNYNNLKGLQTVADIYVQNGLTAADKTAWGASDGVMTIAQQEAMVNSFITAGQLAVNGTATDESKRFVAYAQRNPSSTGIQSVTIMQYMADANDPYVVNGDKSLAPRFYGNAAAGAYAGTAVATDPVASASDYSHLKTASGGNIDWTNLFSE
jgi:prepilin-type N-terminal cleavage/methylation domain-containing protein